MHFAQRAVELRDGVAWRGTLSHADLAEYAQSVVTESWDASIVQLSAGHLDAGVDFFADARFVLYREHWGQRLHSTGALAPGMIAFGVPEPFGDGGSWWGRPLPQGRLPVCWSGSTLEQLSESGQALSVLVMHERDFWPVFSAWTGLDPQDFPKQGRFLAAEPAAIGRLRTSWNRMLARTALAARVELTLADIVAPLLDAIELPLRVDETGARTGGVLDLVLDAASRTQFRASVPEISVRVGLSRRTIESVFRSHLGESPKAYFRKRRLARCHQALLEAAPGEGSVTGIAVHHGFTELGRFAATYRRQFGELPSVTLHRSGSVPSPFVRRG